MNKAPPAADELADTVVAALSFYATPSSYPDQVLTDAGQAARRGMQALADMLAENPAQPPQARPARSVVLAYTCRDCALPVELAVHSRAQLGWAWARAAWRQCPKCFDKD